MNPKSPEVQAAVARACAYLAKSPESRPGAQALVGLTFLKAEQPNHPKVQEGISGAGAVLTSPLARTDVYSLGIAIIFMTELEKGLQAQHAETIRALIAQLKSIQKPHGGWGYPHFETGDTSMTQYAVLAMWSADVAGYDTPQECWEKVVNWAMRCQAPDGGFGYQGKDSGSLTASVEQVRTHESICAAGSGILYMCADYFGLLDNAVNKDTGEALLKKVKKPGVGRKGRETTQVAPDMLWERIGKANAHMDSIFTVHPQIHPYYYLYAFERYKTFKDYSEGNIEKEVAWYDECAKSLFTYQEQDGHWKTWHADVGDVCDTCFGTLFLLRSMYKKVIEIKRLGAGLLVGGRGLPSGEGDLEMSGGTVKRKPLKGPAEGLLAMIANPNDPNFDKALRGLESQSLASDEDHLSDIQKKLRAMFKDNKSPELRVAAVKLLARTRDLDQVPVLLEALKDPDAEVFVAANEGLRFISRKFVLPAFGNGAADDAAHKAAITFWSNWYKSLNTDVELEE
ncbi:MAG TPA: HEAT repeat domain-containing protein [Pirellulales bacterium]|nr:HEAT repeat domain-containing protein [Pirellulales bacterium]